MVPTTSLVSVPTGSSLSSNNRVVGQRTTTTTVLKLQSVMLLISFGILLLLVLIPLSKAVGVNAQQSVMVSSDCPTDAGLRLLEEKYHDDTVGNRYYDNNNNKQYHQRKEMEQHRRSMKYQLLLRPLGTTEHIPNQQTNICPPEESVTLSAISSIPTTRSKNNNIVGLDTVWIVENQASTAIVVSWVNPKDRKEYGAMSNKVYPALNDPKSILHPGEWRVIPTFEGYSYTARSLSVERNGIYQPSIVVGPILLSHTVGLIPIGRSGDRHYQCEKEPVQRLVVSSTSSTLTETSETTAKESMDDGSIMSSSLPSSTSRKDRRMFESRLHGNNMGSSSSCNAIEVGFRNTINCPVIGYHVYYDDVDNIDGTTTCTEYPKHRFGIQSNGLSDYVRDYESTTRYETTYVGHTFRFRLESNPTIIVDTITIEPTIVRDCPSRKTTTASETTGGEVVQEQEVISPTKFDDFVSVPIGMTGTITEVNDLSLQNRNLSTNEDVGCFITNDPITLSSSSSTTRTSTTTTSSSTSKTGPTTL